MCLHQQQRHHSTYLAGNNICLLKTAVATISASGICVEASILFDKGSQCPFIIKSLADCLQLQTHGTEELSISTLAAQTSQIRKPDVTTIQLHTISGQLIPLTILIVPTIATLIQNPTQRLKIGSPCHLCWTVHHTLVNWSRSLLGCSGGPHHKGQCPIAMGSKLRYLLSGPMGTATTRNTHNS